MKLFKLSSNKTTNMADNTNTVLQELLQSQVGFGKAQYKIVSPMFAGNFVKGGMVLVLGLLLPIVRHQWALTTFEASLGLFLIYTGMTVGLLFQPLADKVGRKKTLLVAIIIDLVALLGLLSWNWYLFIFFFFLSQLCNTLTISTTLIYITEVTISEHRPTLYLKLTVYYLLGLCYVCLTGYFLMTPYLWRYMFAVMYVPCLTAIGLYCCWGKETLQYLWAKKEKDQLFGVINWMDMENNGTDRNLIQIQNHFLEEDPFNNSNLNNNLTSDSKALEVVPQRSLFDEHYRGITIRLMIGRFCCVFVYNGITLFLPSIFKYIMPQNGNTRLIEYSLYVAMALIEMSICFLGPRLINNPELGRKKIAYMTFSVMLIASVLPIGMMSLGVIPVLIASIVIKGTNALNQMAFNIYTNELYEPLLRGKAQSLTNLVARIMMAILAGVGLYTLDFLNGIGIFILFAIILFAATVSMYTMPYCTSNSKA